MSASEKTASRRRFVRRGIEFSGTLLAAPALAGAVANPDQTAKGGAAPINETLKTIHGLRTIHGDFSEKQVPDEAVNAILDASIRAANASNMQTYSILVTRDAAKMQKLTGYRASCLLLYCADYTRIADTATHLGYDYWADNVGAFITASTNTILAAQTAVIAAKSLGIDSLLTNAIHRGDVERIWEILELPQRSCFPLIALMLGYPKAEPRYRMGRLKGPGVIHFERFHRLSKAELDEIVRQTDDNALHLALNDEWRRRGHKHYLDWFFKEWDRWAPEEERFHRRAKRLTDHSVKACSVSFSLRTPRVDSFHHGLPLTQAGTAM